MKKNLAQIFFNQRGSVINVALLILILIFLIGIGLSKMSTTDIKIANNIKQKTTTFYETDAGLEETGELIEQNLGCITGFTDTDQGLGLPSGQEVIGGTFYVNNLNFSHTLRKFGERPREFDLNGNDVADSNEDLNGNNLIDTIFTPDDKDASDTQYLVDFYTPWNLDRTLTRDEYLEEPHTYFTVGGASRFSVGSAIQMAAGYEGLGRGSAAGGGSIIYDVYAERVGSHNTSATHFMQWVHIIKPSPGCNF